MIRPINSSLSFKALYQDRNAKFSESQNKVIDDIKAKLGDKLEKEDYYVKAGAFKDSVVLSRLKGLKKTGTGIEQNHTYQDKLLIGTYNEDFPFQLQDVGIAQKNYFQNAFGAVVIMFLVIVGVLAAALGKKDAAKAVEKTVQITDSVAADSAKVLKGAFNK